VAPFFFTRESRPGVQGQQQHHDARDQIAAATGAGSRRAPPAVHATRALGTLRPAAGLADYGITGPAIGRYCVHRHLLDLLPALGALGGYWLMQPRMIANLGLAVYKPPPATRLIPLPRKSDAPELVDLTPTPSDGADAKLDSPPVTTSKATVQTSPKPTAKRSKPKLQHDNAASAYAYAGSWGYRERRSYPDGTDRRWSSWGGGRNTSW